MTRKKSRPQHRENVSPTSANEGGFYKMFWNSMEGSEGNDASAPSPDDLPQNSSSVIIIIDSDDENPRTNEESSSDNCSGIPHPIKQEFLEAQASATEIPQDQSDVIQSEETTEDSVPKTLQPTSPVQSSTATALCETSINSLPPVAYRKTDSEDLVRSPNRADSPPKVCTISQHQLYVSENNVDFDCTVDKSAYLSSPREERISSEAHAIHENGHPLAEVDQVCLVNSPDHQVGELSGNDSGIPLSCQPNINVSTCEDEEMPVRQHLENSSGALPAMSETTGQALELLKSLLVSPDEEQDPPSSTFVNNSFNIDNSVEDNTFNDPACTHPNPTQGEVSRSSPLSMDVFSHHNNQPIICNPPDQVVSSVVSQPVVSNVDLSLFDEPVITDKGESTNSHHKDAVTDEFPVFGHIVPRRIKMEHSCIKRSLDLLRNELFALYDNHHVKEAFECKTDSEVVKDSGDTSGNEEVDFNIPNGTAPCLVMVERLPTPMVRKGYVTLGCKPFQNWKLRIIRQRNEDKFRHLGVWRRGRTRLWRECELAGMDRASYDKQVNYIRKHLINETSSSSEAESSEDESADTSNDNIYDSMFPSATAIASSDESESSDLPSDSLTSCPTPENPHSDILTDIYVSDPTLIKSPTKGKLRGPRSRRYRYSDVKAIEPKVVDHEVSPCREEYVVERNTVNDDLNSGGKKTAPLKITIRKTSINKSEDEREKSVESEVENNFTVPHKPTGKKVKRTFVTKRTYRKPEEHVPQATTSVESDTQKSSPQEPPKKRKVQSAPHYIEDNNENEQSLLGRRSHEVENFNLLEKWDIPFEEPTLFRSPRVASRLAQLKTKEAFTTKKYCARQPAPQKTVLLCKEVKEVVEMLCSKTVEAMLCPDTLSNSSQDANYVASLVLVNLTPEVKNPTEPGALPPQHVSTVETEEAPFKSVCDEDKSETHSNTHEETTSTIDTSECGDSPKKGTEISPSSKKKKKTFFGYRKKKTKAKPACRIVVETSTDEKKDTRNVLGTKLIPRVLIPPLHSTQVPVVSEGPGQSPQESEDDLVQLKVTEATSREGEFGSKDLGMLSKSPQDRKDELVSEKRVLVSQARNTRFKQPAQATESKEVISPRLTRSRQPTVTIDPDVLENFGFRKVNKKSSSDRKNDAPQDNTEDVAAPSEQRVKTVQKKKGKTKSSLPKESSSPAARSVLEEAVDSDNLNTQVHEVSEGPGEVVLDTDETLINLGGTLQNNNTSVDSELESVDSHMGTRENPAQVIPDSPMSPTPDAVENESVQPRMTRSKKRMLRAGSAYIAVKKTDIPNVDGSLVSYSETKSSPEVVQLKKDRTNKVTEVDFPLIPMDKCDISVAVAENPSQNQIQKCDTKEVTETKADSPLVPLDKCDVNATVSEKPSTAVSEHTSNSKCELGSASSAISNESPIMECGAFHSPKLSSDMTECPQVSSQSTPEMLTQRSTTEVDNSNSLIAKQISDSVTSLIHGSNHPCQDSSLVSVREDFLEGQEVSTENAGPKKSAAKLVSPDFAEGSSSPVDPNTSKERRAVLETLNSILKLSSQNKKIADSLTSAGNNNPFSKREEKKTIELHVSDDEFDAGDLVVDEDQDFSDDDDNSADLASRIDQIIKDQITSDIEPPSSAKSSKQTNSSKAETGKENNKDSSGKRRDSIDERTGLPTVLLQKLRDPRIRSKLMSGLEDADASTPNETPQGRPSPKDASDSTKAALTDPPASFIRDPRALRSENMADPRRHAETPVAAPGSALASSVVLNDQIARRILSNIPSVARVTATNASVLSSTANPAAAMRGATNPATISTGTPSPAAVLRGTLNSAAVLRSEASPATNLRDAATPTIGGAVSGIPSTRRGPLLPTPTALLPIVAALRNPPAAVHPTLANSKTAVTPLNASDQPDEVDDDDDEEEEESLKRRPKKQKKEIDTELMYKSPLEDLQSEARPAYGRNPPRRNPRIERRSFSRTDRGMHDFNDTRTSRWDVRYNNRKPERDNPRYLEPHSHNQDRWRTGQVNDHINQNPTDVYQWKRNWYPEYNARANDVIHQEPQLSYMDTHLLNLSLLSKTTNLNCPPFTKIYTHFNHGNPQILGVAPPTFDPKEKASTITMLDPMGQEMIDIVQLPRPTSGLTSNYFNDLPDEFGLEELISHPYQALSDMMDEEVEIEDHGTNIFGDSDEERELVRQASKRHVNDPRSRSSVLIEKTDNIKNKDLKKSVAKDDPLENILHCLPALKEQYAFKKSQVILESDLWGDDSDNLIPPPPPTWSTESSLGHKAKQSEKIVSTRQEDTSKIESWRNPSPPKRKGAVNNPRSPTRRKSRSKSPLHRSARHRSRSISPSRRRSNSKSRSPGRWRSRSPYCKGSGTPCRRSRSRSRSISPSYRSAYKRHSRSRSRDRARSRRRSRSHSLERLGRVRRHKRSRSRSPPYCSSRSSTSRSSASISPSRKRHSRR